MYKNWVKKISEFLDLFLEMISREISKFLVNIWNNVDLWQIVGITSKKS